MVKYITVSTDKTTKIETEIKPTTNTTTPWLQKTNSEVPRDSVRISCRPSIIEIDR